MANLAPRICAIAEGRQILVTNRVHGVVEERVEGTSLGEMDFKGLSRPAPVFEIDDRAD